jgi:hypothetical protein
MVTIPIVSTPYKPRNHDTAKRLVAQGSLKFAPPWIAAGGLKFTWPFGAEGFRIYGGSLNAVHRYIGGNTPDANVIHFHEGRIEMTGTFPGLTSPAMIGKLQDIATSRSKRKTFALPGVLAKVQYVIVDTYDFGHPVDDRTSSIDYSLTLLRVGNTGGGSGSGGGSSALEAVQGLSGAVGAPERASSSKSDRTFSVVQGVDTFRAVADRVYGDVNQWPFLVELNRNTLVNNNPDLANVSAYQLPYYRWPIGTKIAY